MKRTGMNNIKDILRHRHDLGLPRAKIAAAIGVSAGDCVACSGTGVGGGAVVAAAG